MTNKLLSRIVILAALCGWRTDPCVLFLSVPVPAQLTTTSEAIAACISGLSIL